MSSGSAIRAGQAYVEISARDNKLVKTLRATQERLKKFGASIALAGGASMAAGAAVLGPMLAASNVFAVSGDELSKAADKTGASVESLSELRHAAAQSAVDFKALTGAMNKQQRGLSEAAKGNEAARAKFEDLGLSVEELMTLSPDQQFEVIADRIAQIEDPAHRTAAAMDIFGKSGAELMPLMIGGAQGIAQLRKEARDLGLQVSGSDAKNATLLGDTWANVQTVMKDVVFEIGAALAPALTSILQWIIPLIVNTSKWIADNRQLVVTVAGIAAGVVAAGAALVGLGGVMAALSVAIGGAISVASTIMTIIGAIISPAGILIGLVVGLTAAFLMWTESGQSIVSWWGTEFGKLVGVVSDTVGGIFNALKGGRLDLAAKIAWTGVKLAVATVLESLLALVGTNMKDVIRSFVGMIKAVERIRNQTAQKAMDWYTQRTVAAAQKEFEAEAQEISRRFLKGEITSEKAGKLRKQAEFIRDDKIRSETRANQTQKSELEEQAAALEAWDPTEGWAKNFDTGELGAELAALNAEAKKNADQVEAQRLEVAELSFQLRDIDTDPLVELADEVSGQAASGVERADKAAVFGTFSAALTSQNFGAGNLQQEMLAVQKKIEANTAKNTPLVAKS